jgi:magnesium transporter
MKPRKKKNHQINPDIARKEQRISRKTGLPPGSLVHIGKRLTDAVTVNLTTYNSTETFQKKIDTLDDLVIADGFKNWIEVCGLHDTGMIEAIGEKLNINPLVMEDIVNTEHRPKFDIIDGVLFFTLKAFSKSGSGEITGEQASFVLSENFLVTFRESDQAWFEPIRAALISGSIKIKQRGLDYLLYSFIDVIIDQYYAIIEGIGDQLEDLEDMIFENPSRDLIEKNRQIKKEIITFRKALIPALEAVVKMKRDEPDLIRKETIPYYDDIHDHIVQILDSIDTYRELIAELKESYLSNLTVRMNQVMKILTIVTAVFIPLSFISGIYGMNFEFMPELHWKYGYLAVLVVMALITAGMFIYFRRKRWL